MKKVKITAGIIWAILCLILIIILFPGLNNFSTAASKLPFMKINPRYSGGEVAGQVITPGCTLLIRKPVFNGLLGERKNGFVQLDWRGNIPDEVKDTIDYDLDKVPDFGITIDRLNQKTSLYPMKDNVRDVNISSPTSYGWCVRVGLSN